jgi:hypothetical protein
MREMWGSKLQRRKRLRSLDELEKFVCYVSPTLKFA